MFNVIDDDAGQEAVAMTHNPVYIPQHRLLSFHQQRNIRTCSIGIYSANGRAHDISVITPNPYISAGLERVSTSNTQTDERVGGP